MADVATRGAGLDWKTSLQELAPLPASACPTTTSSRTGPDHAKIVHRRRSAIGGRAYGPGAGRNKKEAEQKAAAIAFAALGRRARRRPRGLGRA